MFTNLLLTAALAASTLALPTPDTSIVHERRTAPHADKAGRVKRDAVIPVRIGLAQSNIETLHGHLMDVSHPSSSNYGQHFTSKQVEDMFAPREESVQTVRAWLISNGIDASSISTSKNRGWLAVDIQADKAEALFKAEYHEYKSSRDGAIRLGCDSYDLPEHVSQHVDFIRPRITLSPPLTKNTIKYSKFGRSIGHAKRGAFSYSDDRPAFSPPTNSPSFANCGTDITPACIKQLYGILDATVSAVQDPANAVGVFEQGDFYAEEDLDLYFAHIATNVPKGTRPTVNGINGATAPVNTNDTLNGGESDIDLDMIYGLVYPQAVTLYQADTSQEDGETWVDGFLDAIDGSYCTDDDKSAGQQCGAYDLTRVVSMLYTSPEFSSTFRHQRRSCNEIAKLSLQGRTFVISSGDYGVASHPQGKTNGCASPDANGIDYKYDAVSGNVFQSQFPATCPYVLSVGATQLTSNQTVNDPESVMNTKNVKAAGVGTSFSSSGGFSHYFQAPDYQSNALQAYFDNHDPGYVYYNVQNGKTVGASSGVAGAGVYNRGGRAIPDVSANGASFATYNKGRFTHFYGTSLATPLWAALITLLNEERCAAGKSPVGFINPVLYKHPEAFTDIVSGSNSGCNTEGFPAVTGWDPSTGLGTPKYEALLQIMMDLP